MPWLFAQLPGVDDAVKSAAEQGWLEVTFVVIVLGAFTAFGWMMKHLTVRHSAIEERMQVDAQAREIRLSDRVTSLEDNTFKHLMTLVQTNSEAMGKMMAAAESVCRSADRMTETLSRFMSMIESGVCPLSKRELEPEEK